MYLSSLTVVNVWSISGELEVSHSQGLQWWKPLSFLKPLVEKPLVIKLKGVQDNTKLP